LLGAGVYFIKFRAGAFRQIHKIVTLK